jgi:hypothetical protein
MDYYSYYKYTRPHDYDYYGYRRYPYRYYPIHRPYPYYYGGYGGIYGSNISSINQSLINSGSMSNVYQNALINQLR